MSFQPIQEPYVALRTKALESLLIEKGLLTAEDIDRRMNELRLAARDFVTDPGTQSVQVGEAATALGEVLKKTRIELAPEQQEMIDGVAERLTTYRSGIDRISALINRRAEMIVALPPLREQFDAAIAATSDPHTASTLFQTQSRIVEDTLEPTVVTDVMAWMLAVPTIVPLGTARTISSIAR